MKKSQKILITILGILNLIITSLLLIFVIPSRVPVLFDKYEQVSLITTKWIFTILCVLPLIFGALSICLKNKKISFLFLILFVLSIFENFLHFSYFSVEKSISIGDLNAIPISISIFMPISVIISVLAIKLKNAPYLSTPALPFKPTKATEFIWKQTHFYARDLYFFMGIIMFFVSIVFAIFRFPLIELLIFVILIFVFTLKVYLYSKSIYKKYTEMKVKKEKMDKEQSSKTAKKTESKNEETTQNESKSLEKKDKNK